MAAERKVQAALDTAQNGVWDLVDRARSGDHQAVSALYRNHVGLVRSYLYARCGDWPLAEDLTSETFVRALSRIDRLTHRGSSFGAWLTTIARNLFFDVKKAARERYEVPASDVIDIADDFADPFDQLSRELDAKYVRRTLAALTAEQRECVFLRFFAGLGVKEVAVVMNRDPGSVRALQCRALKKLAVLIGQNGHGEAGSTTRHGACGTEIGPLLEVYR